MAYKDILVEAQGEIGSITLNSPSTVNALSKNMIREVIVALEEFAANAALKVIILKANGKHFCAGHYLKEMIDGNVTEYRFIFNQCSTMMKLIHQVPQVVIAQVHGVATAAGCQMVGTCDLAVADVTARFGTPGVRIGLFCTTPMVALSRACGQEACHGNAHDRSAHLRGRGASSWAGKQGRTGGGVGQDREGYGRDYMRGKPTCAENREARVLQPDRTGRTPGLTNTPLKSLPRILWQRTHRRVSKHFWISGNRPGRAAERSYKKLASEKAGRIVLSHHKPLVP